MRDSWLALRNVGRNRRRTVLVLLIMAVGTTGLIVNSGLITYIFNGLRDVAIYGRFGHLQVYKSGYKLNHQQSPLEYWMSDDEYTRLERRLRQFDHVKAVAPETTLPVYLTWGGRSAAGLATGTAPADMKLLTATRLVAGREEIRDAGSFAEAVVGRGLAEKLQLHVGDVLTITASGRNQGYSALDVQVNGIFEEGFRDYDDWTLKLPLSAVQRLSGQSGVEKLIVLLDDTAQTSKVRAHVEDTLRAEGFAVEMTSWLELAEFYRQVIAMFGKELNVIQWIIQVLVFFSVVTGMAMVYTERQHEMATLLAMGMTRIRLVMLFARESFWIGLLAVVLSVVAGITASFIISHIGINMPPPPGSTRGFVARVDFSATRIVYYSLLSLFVACSAAIIPAFWIWRLDIAAALRQERN
jgi:putative ABC transport system permease protein